MFFNLGNGDILSVIKDILLLLPGILIGFTFHEYAHAYMSDRFGDPTPRSQGRLTVNPLVHIDIIGLILIIVFGFGWAKPVQTNPSYYRGNVKEKDIMVSLAGLVMNLIIAFIAAAIFTLLNKAGISNMIAPVPRDIISSMLDGVVLMNSMLFIFNLIPIPPLDGFRVLVNFLPSSTYRAIYTIERYGSFILMFILLVPATRQIINNITVSVYLNIFHILGY